VEDTLTEWGFESSIGVFRGKSAGSD